MAMVEPCLSESLIEEGVIYRDGNAKSPKSLIKLKNK